MALALAAVGAWRWGALRPVLRAGRRSPSTSSGWRAGCCCTPPAAARPEHLRAALAGLHPLPLHPALSRRCWPRCRSSSPLGYLLGRVVSIAGVRRRPGAAAGGCVRARRAASPALPGGRRPACRRSACGAGGRRARWPASFAATGGFYDLVRADSLLLLLDGRRCRWPWPPPPGGGLTSAAAAAGLLHRARLLHQADRLGAGHRRSGLGLLLASWRRGLVYGAAAAAHPGRWGCCLLNLGSDGWFWTYVFELHQSHEFYAPPGLRRDARCTCCGMAGPLYLAWLRGRPGPAGRARTCAGSTRPRRRWPWGASSRPASASAPSGPSTTPSSRRSTSRPSRPRSGPRRLAALSPAARAGGPPRLRRRDGGGRPGPGGAGRAHRAARSAAALPPAPRTTPRPSGS